MMAYTSVKELLIAICDSIRVRKGTTEVIKHQDIPTEIEYVCDKCYKKGRTNEYDTFWDSCQEYGNRTGYMYGFGGRSWTDETFKPKYDITPVGNCSYMFRYSKITDVTACLKEQGIDGLDFTNVTTSNYLFRDSIITKLPKIIIGDYTMMNGFFPYAENLEVIEELYLPPTYDAQAGVLFNYCGKLRECNITGTVTKDIDFTDSSLLTTEDAINTIQHLKDYSSDETKRNKYTLTFHADVWARLLALGNVSPNGNKWEEYVVDLGWNKA